MLEPILISALVGYFGYRRDRLAAEAEKLLGEMESKLDRAEWPYPVIKYLKRSLTANQLLSAAKDNDQLTEAHGYLGLDLILNEKPDEGISHLQLVSEKGNREFNEYRMAVDELRRLNREKAEKTR